MKDLHVHIEDRQAQLLRAESELSGLSMAALVRRAIDFTYAPSARPRVGGWQASLGFWRRPDAAAVGRRAGLRS